MSVTETDGTKSRSERDKFNALIAAIAQRRDRDAFAQLFSHYAPRLKSFLRGGGTEADVAEELAQEAMLMVWRKAPQFDPAKASAATWIFTIARNLRIDRLRREKRPTLDPHDPLLVAEAASPDREAESAQLFRSVRTALVALPEEQAQVIRLAFFEEQTHTEIAKALGLPLGTVKSRLRLALDRIRKFMEGRE